MVKPDINLQPINTEKQNKSKDNKASLPSPILEIGKKNCINI